MVGREKQEKREAGEQHGRVETIPYVYSENTHLWRI